MSDASSYITLPIFEETGYVILDAYDQAQDPREWEDLTFVDWKSSGDTRFAPLASAYGDMECNGFWNHTPPKTDKDGVWVPANVEVAPRLVARAQEPGSNIGRCRVIELMPNTYGDTLYNLHRDDNNRLNPEGTGWIVRSFFNLTDNPDAVMVLREDRDDPSTETRIPLPGRRPGHHRHPATVARRVAPRPGPALLPHHVVGERPRARRLHHGEERAPALRHRAAGPGGRGRGRGARPAAPRRSCGGPRGPRRRPHLR